MKKISEPAYIGPQQIMEDWDVSKATAYNICILRRRAATGAFASGHPALPAAGVNRPLYVQS